MSIWDPDHWSDVSAEDEHLDPGEIATLGKVLDEWVHRNPRADRPLLYLAALANTHTDPFVDGLTPRELARAVNDGTSPLHDPVLRIFQTGLRGYSGGIHDAVGQVMAAFMGDIRGWQAENG